MRERGRGNVVDHFLDRVTNALEVRHARPRALFDEIANLIGGESDAVLDKAAEVVVGQRSVLMAPKNAVEAVAAAKQLLREAAAKPAAGVTITKAGYPQQWAAWRKAADREPARYRAIGKIMSLASECMVPSPWPPGRGG